MGVIAGYRRYKLRRIYFAARSGAQNFEEAIQVHTKIFGAQAIQTLSILGKHCL